MISGCLLRNATLELSSVCYECEPNPDEQLKAIEELRDAGAGIHPADKIGVTALHHAVRFRSTVAVATLLECGANVNQTCKRSGSAPRIEPSRRRLLLVLTSAASPLMALPGTFCCSKAILQTCGNFSTCVLHEAACLLVFQHVLYF